MRRKFIKFIADLGKVKPGCLYPKWVCIIIRILFPINSFLLQRFDYDPCSDSVCIYGQRVPKHFFDMTRWKANAVQYEEYYKVFKDGKGMLNFHRYIEDKRSYWTIEILEKCSELGIIVYIENLGYYWRAYTTLYRVAAKGNNFIGVVQELAERIANDYPSIRFKEWYNEKLNKGV